MTACFNRREQSKRRTRDGSAVRNCCLPMTLPMTGTDFGLRWQAERDTAFDGRSGKCGNFLSYESAVAAALCRRSPYFPVQAFDTGTTRTEIQKTFSRIWRISLLAVPTLRPPYLFNFPPLTNDRLLQQEETKQTKSQRWVGIPRR